LGHIGLPTVLLLATYWAWPRYFG